MTQRKTWNSLVTLFLFIGGPCLFAKPSTAPVPSAAERYFNLLDKAITCSRSQIPTITASAEQAARKILAGGTLWGAGRQEDFPSEALGRAGGLMGLKALGNQIPKKNDVVLYAIPGYYNDLDFKRIKEWHAQGTSVITFAAMGKGAIVGSILIANNEPTNPNGLFFIGGEQQMICPVDTVANVINLWVWTGEFVSACTRAGKMPVLYQSIGLPGGRERIVKYTGKMFHDDMKIKPIAPGVLGRAYLDQIQNILASIRKTEMAKIIQAGDWWRDTPSDKVHILVMGHMFPQHFQDPRTPQKGSFFTASHEFMFGCLAGIPRFILFVGYQYAPQHLADQAAGKDFKLVYFSVQPAKLTDQKNSILYIDPHWPLTDGCVKVPGYDIPILPASGVIDAALYWAILAQVCEK